MPKQSAEHAQLSTKSCTKCGTTKPIDEFPKDKGSSGGRRSYCKACHRAANLADYYKNKEAYDARALKRYYANKKEYAENNKKWHEKNKEKRALYAKEYGQKNKDRIRQYNKERHARTKELRNKQSKEWRTRNPGVSSSYSHTRRAKLAGQGGKHTLADIQRIKSAQKSRCAICKKILPKQFHRDHIVPISRGGTNEAKNIQLTCGPCNSSKHAKDPIEFMQELGYLL